MVQLGVFDYYLIVINIIGFVAYLINMFLYNNTEEGRLICLDHSLLLGGSDGILLTILTFDRKSVKGNMMSRVFIECVFVIQVIILLVVKGHHADSISLAF